MQVLDIFIKFVGWLFGWLTGRPKLKVRIIKDDPDKEVGGLEFEIENQSKTETSLSPRVRVRFLTYKGKATYMDFDVRELDRHLAPFEPKLLSASARFVQPERFHGLFRTYSFRPTNGRALRVRIRNASLEEIGLFRFLIEKLWFKLTDKVNVNRSETIDKYRARQRARGPH